MGLFDSLRNVFSHHEHHHGAALGDPLTLRDAKALLSSIMVQQHLLDMRKVADAVRQLQDDEPQLITFVMSHYYSEPSACASSPKTASSSTRTPSQRHTRRPSCCRTSAKSSIS